MGQGRPHGPTDPRIGYDLANPSQLVCRDPPEIDRPDLVCQDQSVSSLPGMPGWNRDLAGVSGRPGRDRTDRRHAGPVKGLVRDDERTPMALLLVADGRVEVDEHDRPAEGPGQAGQVSASSNVAVSPPISRWKSSSWAADSQDRDSSSSRAAL
jgi:hypothetical protein